MNEIPTEIVKAATSRPTFPKFAKGGFIPLKPLPDAGQNCDEKELIGPPELFVRIWGDEKCSMEKLSDALISESIPTDSFFSGSVTRKCELPGRDLWWRDIIQHAICPLSVYG